MGNFDCLGKTEGRIESLFVYEDGFAAKCPSISAIALPAFPKLEAVQTLTVGVLFIIYKETKIQVLR